MAQFPRSLAILVFSAAAITASSCGGTKYLSVQRDPGREGNGVEQQDAPYTPPIELTQRLNNAPYGRLSQPATFFSETYKLNFKYRIYVPVQYEYQKTAALMVFQDASDVYLGAMNTPLLLDNLIHQGDIPVTIALFLDPGTQTGEFVRERDAELRSQQYDATDGQYAKFLTEEIIRKVVRKKYKLVTDPGGWALVGHGSGGVAAFTAAWERPDFFRKVLTQNASFVNIKGAGKYAELVRTDPVKPIRVYMLSSENDMNSSFGNWLAGNRAMASAFGERDYDYRLRIGTGAHVPPQQAQADFADALRWLWRGFSIDTKAGLIRQAMSQPARSGDGMP